MNRKFNLTAAIVFSLALPLFGQNFTYDGSPGNPSGPYGVNTYRHTNDFAVKTDIGGPGNVRFNNTTGTGTDPYDVSPVSLKETTLTLASGELVVFDFCAELFVGPTGSSSYFVTSGFGGLSANQVELRKLLSNTLGDFIFARDNTGFDSAATIGAAIQLAIWEIVEDDNPTRSLDEGGTAGKLSVNLAGTSMGNTDDAVALAEIYLSNLAGWSDNSAAQGLNYYYADSAGEQDRLWVTLSPIPEPSIAALSALGMLALLRRRRPDAA